MLLSIWLFLYWIFNWCLSNGHKVFVDWSLNFTLIFIQEVIIAQSIQIYVIYFLASVSIQPQLQVIQRVLYLRGMQVIREKKMKETPHTIEKILPYVSGACRAAYHPKFANIPAALILRRLKDEDIILLRQKNHDRSKGTSNIPHHATSRCI